MNISVFGSSTPKPGEPAYQEALMLGKLLGESNFTVLNGGYMGTMEAVSRGVSETGGHVIGVTSPDIEAWRPSKPNDWIKEEIRCTTARERMFVLIDQCVAALALPGGAGTIAEITMMWNQIIINTISERPLILIGHGWRQFFLNFFEIFPSYTPHQHRDFLSYTDTIDQALDRIKILLQ